MPLKCTCSHCGATLRIAEGYAPAVIPCPRCGSEIANPFHAVATEAAPAAAPEPAANDSRPPSESAQAAAPNEPPVGGQPPVPSRAADAPADAVAPAAKKREPNELQQFLAALCQTTPRAWVTTTIVALNVMVYLVVITAGAGLLAHAGPLAFGANYGPRTTHGQWWRLLTANYLHVYWWHIGLNMLVLIDVGRLLERLLGSFAFLVVYTASGILGSLAGVYFNPYVASAGASGAIFGLGGALLAYVLFAHQGLPENVARRLRKSVILFIVLNVALGLSIPMVDNAAHLGGLAAGFLLGLIVQTPLGAVTPRRRMLRGLIGAAAGSAIILLGARYAPALIDIEREATEAVHLWQQAIARSESLWNQAAAGVISEAAQADAIEQEILPAWSAQRERLSHVAGLPPHQAQYMQALSRSFSVREQSWRRLVAGLRGDETGRVDFLRYWDEANRLEEELGRQ